MTLNEKIKNQIDAGFTKDEIIDNLKLDGHTEEEIKASIKEVSKSNKFRIYKVNRVTLSIGLFTLTMGSCKACVFANSGRSMEIMETGGADSTNAMVVLFSVVAFIGLLIVIFSAVSRK